jgi:hypothetical protein
VNKKGREVNYLSALICYKLIKTNDNINLPMMEETEKKKYIKEKDEPKGGLGEEGGGRR